jgi:uncharacterized cupin superfamily protein
VLLKNWSSEQWNSVNNVVEVQNGDSLMIGNTEQAECSIAESVRLLLKDLCKLVAGIDEGKIILELVNGQLFLDRQKPEVEIEVRAKECVISPIGTAAVIKITKTGDPGVAVLKGKIRMTNPSGSTVDVGAGMYCTYSAGTGAFSPVKQLSPNALSALESWTGVKYEPQPVAQADELAKEETPKEEKTPEKTDEKKEGEGPEKPAWELSAAMVTVDNEQWTRIALAVDVPIWRFGVCFDVEMFLDAKGNFTNKGWNFESGKDVAETLTRKIRYVRFNHLGDPLFIKFGGLDNVTFGYGFIIDRFTNMLHYPGEKLLGLQFDLNDISPIGITLQTLIPDFQDFGNEGGILGTRLAFKPLKATDKFLIKGISIGGSFVADLNQYAPARNWDYSLKGPEEDKDEDNIVDGDWQEENNIILHGDSLTLEERVKLIEANRYDVLVAHKDAWAKDEKDKIMIAGGDISIPIITTKILNLDIYAQSGVTLDAEDEDKDKIYKGWGIGAPGVAVKAGPVWARVEYRHIRDRFSPGYFGPYYLDERIVRTPNIHVKEDDLQSVKLNGVFGLLGCNIANLFIVSGSYQRLGGKGAELDQRAEGTAAVGQKVIERIPKIKKVEAFYYQTDINKKEKRPFFYQSPTTYWGYRLGIEVVAHTFIIWETRYGWVLNKEGTEYVDNKTVTIQAGLSF